ncbi:MAG: leucyl/phenylalanyl-tRNA--protein transferase [Gammaproteobacteria bacterium HGW-Gammaproteobacteria-6]|nr:MAG: leucyl/phenylalanyl-tRNA--protein transferase [Gammaproteobacteria bacterium HGW-Gammaproteobacteria-6]
MTQLTWLDPDSLEFPQAEMALAEPPGLLAAGGDLSPARLLAAYRRGIFPWYQDGQPLLWWCPAPRTVLIPKKLHISRSMQKFLRQSDLQLSIDRDFAGVIRACAEPRVYADSTWITEEMQAAYRRLHALGIAHSVEVWEDTVLVGGLYGLAIGRVFFGESMFSRRSNASKAAFIHLVTQLASWDFSLIDCQMPTDHLFSLGAESMDREQFLAQLQRDCSEDMPNAWGGMQ